MKRWVTNFILLLEDLLITREEKVFQWVFKFVKLLHCYGFESLPLSRLFTLRHQVGCMKFITITRSMLLFLPFQHPRCFVRKKYCNHVAPLNCVTRAPLLYFIWSWVALSFKVCQSVSQSGIGNTCPDISTLCNIKRHECPLLAQ